MLNVSLRHGHRRTFDGRNQRDRIASAAFAHGLRIYGRVAVLADQPLWSVVITDGAADLTGVQHGDDLSIRSLVDQEAHRLAIHIRRVAPQFAWLHAINLYRRLAG